MLLMSSPLTLRSLLPSDMQTVESWLRDYVQQHRAWWKSAYGAEPKSTLDEVVASELGDLVKDAERDEYFVRLLAAETVPGAANGSPAGIVIARLQLDRFMGLQIGTLSWIYVDPLARGSGAANQLMEAAESWFTERDAEGRMVFVTEVNAQAVRLYERHGYKVVDHRMLKQGQ